MIRRICTFALVALWALALVGASAEVGIANPWTETTAEGAMEALGLELGVPEGATDVSWRMLEEEQLAEMTFTWYELPYTARVKPADAFEDISGLYYDWPQELECVVGGRCKGVCRRATDGDVTVDNCLWYDEATGLMYSVSAQWPDMDGFDIQASAEQLYVPGQTE